MNKVKTPELLAPAGSMEAFFAALDSGADAVYLGLKAFSARGRAANFTISDLERLVPYAHSLGRKVYVAMNTIVKEDELPVVVENLSALSALNVDAVIIQDLGIYRIMRDHFPGLTIHASTQMTVHNSAGINQLSEMGFKRIVVAREMTLDEIRIARKRSNVEIEAFVHGSMCFSYAGSCFFSSYLGGKSSNRGVCTQPCRREYRAGHDEMNPFSMGDLSALELIPQLMNTGIDSFKIEGRMKSVEYVDNVVKAYRMVMDAAPADEAHALEQARGLLKDVMGRQRTTGFFLDERPKSITVPGRTGNLGRFAGKVINCKGTRAQLRTAVDLHIRDRLRIQSAKTGGRTPFSLSHIWVKGKNVTKVKKGENIEIAVPNKLAPGDTIFKTTSHEHRGKNIEARRRFEKLKGEKVEQASRKAAGRLISAMKEESIGASKGTALAGALVRVARLEDVYRFAGQADGVIVPLYRVALHNLRKHMKRLRLMRERIVWALPLVIQEEEVPMYGEVVDYLVKEGFINWQVSNIGHFNLLKPFGCRLMSSQYLHALNSSAILALKELGCSRVTLSIESDAENLDALTAKGAPLVGDLLVYSHLPLYVSRVKWEKKKKGSYGDKDGDRYIPKERDGVTYVYSDKPFSFFGYMKRFKRMGFRNFQIDLSGESSEREDYGEIFSSFKTGKWLDECSPMNMETGLE